MMQKYQILKKKFLPRLIITNFHSVYRSLKKIGNTDHISAWQSKGFA